MLRRMDVETHLVVSQSAQITLAHETGMKIQDLKDLASVTYSNADIGAAISSGSFKTDGIVIAPCSIKSMSEIATGVIGSLLSRAADVVLKERRRLVLMLRETPLHLGHIRSIRPSPKRARSSIRRCRRSTRCRSPSRRWWTTRSAGCSICSGWNRSRCAAGSRPRTTRGKQKARNP